MPLFDRVLIVGTGFMGNALANALFDNQLANAIIGVEPEEKHRYQAKSNNCYQDIFSNLSQVVAIPEVTIICSPVETVVETACKLLLQFPESLVSDITSVKSMVVSGVQNRAPAHCSRFIGAHPIAGSDLSGPVTPPDSIFTGRICVLTPLPQNPEPAVNKIKSLWQAIGSKTKQMSCEQHDEFLGMTSHLPHAIASALSAALSQGELEYCGTGILDTIRIARSNPLLWKQIFVHNRESVLNAMDRFQALFDDFRNSLENNSTEDLFSILEKGQQNRDALGN
ncbi:MAG: prephenate dehydrogenase [Planctomycetota bacterium]|nr:prephenate dehydrogenase [Planctomycetota bacterium]